MKAVRTVGHRGRERGNVLVEFSIVGTIVMTVMFGVVEVGRLLLIYNTLDEAARAGERYAATHGADRSGSGSDGPSGPAANPSNVVSVVTGAATAAGLSTNSLTVSVSYPGSSNDPGQLVSVTATYSYSPLAAIVPFATFNISSSTQGTICY